MEFVYPPLEIDTIKKSDSGAIQLPEPWQDLPNLCIPDGAHTVQEGISNTKPITPMILPGVVYI